IVLYSPATSSLNLGDHVIAEAAKKEIGPFLQDAFVSEISTHLPLSWYYMRHFKSFDYRFVLGSNLLKSTFFGFKRQWNITLRMFKLAGPVVLVGAGWWQYGNKPNLYTKILLRSYLSKDHIHSVRDEYTKRVLNEMGIMNVVNTSCPTMWSLTPEHCSEIKKEKSSTVVFTLTDYAKDYESDKFLIETLLRNYKKVIFWPQGAKDDEYFSELNVKSSNLEVISPSLKSFDKLLQNGDIDYVGTRLHGGVRALQHKIRTLIIGVDNRAEEKKRDFNIPVLTRKNISSLDEVVSNSYSTEIIIPIDMINTWKAQFQL
ncbi:MAG: polysaccharide pyruvyl transferase family protein, partial [Campylobacterales bacterium]|nr:polysaccharide pyruvyl transferase family protein [Campylobacterales bacterium]